MRWWYPVFGSGHGNNESFKEMEIVSLGGHGRAAAREAAWKIPSVHGIFFFFAAVCRLHRPCRRTIVAPHHGHHFLGSRPVLASSTDCAGAVPGLVASGWGLAKT